MPTTMNTKAKTVLLAILTLLCCSTASFGQDVEQWGRFEKSFTGPSSGNPFTKVDFSAEFRLKGSSAAPVKVRGFYDGDGQYLLRFMPFEPGEWEYRTSSNVRALNGRKGSFVCAPSSLDGPVRVDGEHAFRYAGGGRFYPFGTTAYAWIHTTDEIQKETLESLEAAKFNKVRMCLFPKFYQYINIEPTLFPYERKADGSFDFETFNPEFFHHLEKRIMQLDSIGVQADLILFHPYDKGHWGFDSMPKEANLRYIEYVCARLSSFSNVWWSLANEYDYVKAKTDEEWAEYISAVRRNDPYGHLCSIHGSTAKYYPYWGDELTHTSIQDEGPVLDGGRASILYCVYRKPVILDEVAYEGNLPSRWGWLSGEEMLYRIWNGLTCGVYVTHGECYNDYPAQKDTIFWAAGGKWRGESWKRIAFARGIMESLPNPPRLADVSRDLLTSAAGEGQYLLYFGKTVQDEWMFNLPQKNSTFGNLSAGKRFRVQIVDTWNMTVEDVPGVFETGELETYRFFDVNHRRIRLPLRPYLLLRIYPAQ